MALSIWPTCKAFVRIITENFVPLKTNMETKWERGRKDVFCSMLKATACKYILFCLKCIQMYISLCSNAYPNIDRNNRLSLLCIKLIERQRFFLPSGSRQASDFNQSEYYIGTKSGI